MGRKLFQDLHFLIVEPDNEVVPNLQRLKSAITANGGTHALVVASKSEHWMQRNRVCHVLTQTVHFAGCARAADLMLPVTTLQWVLDSVEQNQKKNYRLYMPEPVPAMAGLVLCAANNLPQGDKDMIYSAVRQFGGQYLDQLSRYTTHLVTVDTVNSKAVVAAHVIRKQNLEIKLVLPSWFAECLRQQKHVPEAPYLLADPAVGDSGTPNLKEQKEATSRSPALSSVLAGKRVYLSTDFNLSKPFIDLLEALVVSHGATLVSEFDVDHIDIFVCKYRSGERFKRCCSSERVHVGLMVWLFRTIASGRYVSPMHSNLLLFPFPKVRIARFENLRISITGINGDARHYLMLLITIMGAVFTKTLDVKNDILVCGTESSEKHLAAQSRWDKIKVVNSLWIEECYANWKFLDPCDFRYTNLKNEDKLLGETRLTQNLLEDWVDRGAEVSGIEDSAGEESDDVMAVPTEEAAGPKTQELESALAEKQLENETDSRKMEKVNEEYNADGDVEEDYEDGQNGQGEQKQQEDCDKLTQNGIEAKKPELVYEIPSSPLPERASRSAKQKASLKLHSDMEDLNKYTLMSKSSRKMKSYMDELEQKVSKTSSKKRDSKEHSVELINEKENDRPVSKKKIKVEGSSRYVAIMTGCELVLTLTRADSAKLARVGITIVNDYDISKRFIDTIVAPKVLRTEKFLKSISQAARIVHPQYLSAVLSQLGDKLTQISEADLHAKVNIDNFSLDKVLSVKQVNEELGYEGTDNGLAALLSVKGQRLVFSELSLNLSSNLNGGPQLIESILKAHGLKDSRVIKLSSTTKNQDFVSLPNGDVLLVAHKLKDQKFKPKGVIVVDWNWCVKCIFHRKVMPY